MSVKHSDHMLVGGNGYIAAPGVPTNKQTDEQTRCTVNRTLLPLKVFYFLFYGACGSVIPFISVLMKSLHLSAAETGVVTGVSVLIAIFLRTGIGVAADRMSARKAFLMCCCAGFGSAFFFLWFVPPREASRPAGNYKHNTSGMLRPGPQSDQLLTVDFWVCLAPDDSELCRYPYTPGHTPCQLIVQQDPYQRRHLDLTQLSPGDSFLKEQIGRSEKVSKPPNIGSEASTQSEPVGFQRQSLLQQKVPISDKVGVSTATKHRNGRPCFVLTKPITAATFAYPTVAEEGVSSPSEDESLTGTNQPYTMSPWTQSKTKTKMDTDTCLLNCIPVRLGSKQNFIDKSVAEEKLQSDMMQQQPEVTVSIATDADKRNSSKPKAFTADSAFLVSFILVTTARAFYSSATSLVDAVAYTTLGPNRLKWGRQRMWGSVGTALSVMIATTINDQLKGDGFDALFSICLGLSLMATLVGGICLKADRSPRRPSIRRDICRLLRQGNVRLFLLKLVAYGIACGTAQNFFLWFLVDLGSEQTTLGLCVAVYCVSSILVLRFSSRIFKLVSHANILYLVMAIYVVRFLAFSFLENPWLALPVELLHGVTYSLMWAAASSTASQMALAGTEASCQALAGAAYWDLGRGLGNLLCGQMIQCIGGRWTFRAYAGACALLLPLFWSLDRLWSIEKHHGMPIATHDEAEDFSVACKEDGNINNNNGIIITNSYDKDGAQRNKILDIVSGDDKTSTALLENGNIHERHSLSNHGSIHSVYNVDDETQSLACPESTQSIDIGDKPQIPVDPASSNSPTSTHSIDIGNRPQSLSASGSTHSLSSGDKPPFV
ncbi:major facilitator superfamily domain-containing protein 6-like [Plakobranchus ocellatus]|uniref:Major facilitator superfamily domain-containing protein 6-like n=1 Tax=Plakobranchus ocellatus TaxID=259542 RepID=A0AAV4D4S4_9GAST|nr:major facilitator superfamily domain-containing protein 6-like [Plakobranchus ocellatus]